jgi:2-oxoglutarate ferredoxin oxidoreductase subunit delta
MKHHVLIDRERCKGCAFCIAACARSLIKLSKRLNALGHHFAESEGEGQCGGCQQCAVICPEAAIEIETEEAKLAEGRTAKPAQSAAAGQTWTSLWPNAPAPRRGAGAKSGVLAKEKV